MTVLKFRRASNSYGIDIGKQEVPAPTPAHSELPEWYRALSDRHGDRGAGTTTVKMCRPFGDALRLGYIIPSPERITVSASENGVEADGAIVSVYDHETSGERLRDGNSAFELPQFELTIPWEIQAPPECGVLVTHPLNRSVTGLVPYSLYIDDPSGGETLTVPARIEQEPVTVDRGAPLLQVIPFHSDALLKKADHRNFSNYGDILDDHEHHDTMSSARLDWYRTERWQKKRPASVTEEATKRSDSKREFTTDTIPFYAKTTDFGVSRPPISAEKMIPEKYRMKLVEEGPVSTQVGEQVIAAMSLGVITRTTGETTVSQADNGIDVSSEYANQLVSKMMDVKLGDKIDGIGLRAFTVQEQWVPKPPEGYSVLFTHPMNHCQTWYRAYSGLSDMDKYLVTANHPGLIRIANDTTVTLGDNMPVGQLLPIHRDGFVTEATVQRA